jgi:hypothetical protein
MLPPEHALASPPDNLVALGDAGGQMVPFTAQPLPVAELGEFDKLPAHEQERIHLLRACFQLMSGNVVAQSHILAGKLKGQRGYSAKNLQTLFYAYKTGGWRALVRGYIGPKKLEGEFIEWLRAEMDANARSISAQIEVAKRMWREGAAIPGYGTWQDWFAREHPDFDMPARCPGFPRGWSKSNLHTLRSAKAQRLLKTKGLAAAKGAMVSLERDPSKLRPLELIVVDDFEVDQMCVYHDRDKGVRQVCRMTGIKAMDVATRKKLSVGMKPRVEHDDGTKEAIHRRELRYMLYCLISEYGLPTEYPITILCENASAAIEHDFELALGRLFGGRIRVTRTGLIDHRTLENGFVQGGGKPWEKGWIESAFNLMHNVAGALPGQKGSSYQNKPADLARKLLYTERLLSTGPQGLNLSDEQVSALRLPFLSHNDLQQAYEIVFRLMEDRTEHKLLGFDAVLEWRRHEAEEWQPYEKLALLAPEEQPLALIRERKESPAERWAKLNAQAECRREKVADHVLASLLLQPKKARLKNGRVTFTHQGKGYTFADTLAYQLIDREGEEVLCFFDENNADCVHVYNAAGAFVQTIRRLGAADITDPKQTAIAAQRVHELNQQPIEAVRQRHHEEAAEIAGMVAHNEALAPGSHADRSVRRALGFSAAEAKAIEPGALPPPTTLPVSATLAQARKAGPIARDAFAGAQAVSSAAQQQAAEKAKTKSLQRVRTDGADLLGDEEKDTYQAPASAADELL